MHCNIIVHQLHARYSCWNERLLISGMSIATMANNVHNSFRVNYLCRLCVEILLQPFHFHMLLNRIFCSPSLFHFFSAKHTKMCAHFRKYNVFAQIKLFKVIWRQINMISSRLIFVGFISNSTDNQICHIYTQKEAYNFYFCYYFFFFSSLSSFTPFLRW